MSKYYAVAIGREIGIFPTWSECKKNVHGFSGAIFKSFKNLCDAEIFFNKFKNKNEEEKEIEKETEIILIKDDKKIEVNNNNNNNTNEKETEMYNILIKDDKKIEVDDNNNTNERKRKRNNNYNSLIRYDDHNFWNKKRKIFTPETIEKKKNEELPKRYWGKFSCSCGKWWNSAYVWLNKKQQCKNCKTWIFADSLSDLKKGKKRNNDIHHCEENCQMCIELGHYCKKITKYDVIVKREGLF